MRFGCDLRSMRTMVKRKRQSVRLFGVVAFTLRAAFCIAGISEVEMARCNGAAAIHQGAKGGVCLLRGDGVDQVQGNPVVSGSGVTGTIIERRTALQNQSQSGKAVASVKIVFDCSDNAPPGPRTVTLRYATGQQDRFTLNVNPRAKITKTELPVLSGWFQQNVDVVILGENLESATVVPAILKDSSHPLLTPASQSATANVSAAIIGNSNTTIRARLNFSHPLVVATVRLTLASRDECSGLYPPGAVTLDVTMDARAGSASTFVQSVSFPFGNAPKVGSVAKIRVSLTRPARADSPVFDPGSGRRIAGTGQDVLFFILEPADTFEQVAGGTPYEPSRLNEIKIPVGERFIDLSFLVKKCPGAGNRSAVFLKTWMQNPNVNTVPEFKQTQFFVDCSK